MFKAVLFDLDNTLIDFSKMKKLSSEAAISAMIESGLPLEEKEAMEKLYKMYGKHGMENQNIFETFLEEVMGNIDYKILANAVVAYRRVKDGHLVTYPHVNSTLIKLKEAGLKLGIVSDAPRMQAWLRLASLNLTDFFDVVVTLDDTGHLKPSEMPFKQAIKKLSVGAKEILFVGDNPERDIAGAKKVGMKTALAKYGQYVEGGEKADFDLKSIGDIVKIVAGK